MTRPVRFAIIGLGVVGARHAQTFRKSRGRDFVLSAAVEINPKVASGADAINELELSNAMYISAFANKAVTLPIDAREAETLLDRLEKQRSTGKGNRQRAKADAALRKLLGSSHT
jgi:guanylate kinase